jgi:hypothetical protein
MRQILIAGDIVGVFYGKTAGIEEVERGWRRLVLPEATRSRRPTDSL